MKQIFLALFILFLSCSGKEKKVTNENLQLSDKWIEYKTKDSIPKLLKLVLDKLNKESFKIANQDEVFNATDVMLNDSIPNKQLRLLATKDNK
ncbi:hypothetical protein [uncultured Flavobacterium sp.]|uniref:hypothetical protein n=1 Tax=uncultured Flavobacterium sp. TaxID=165435 RepID=UPI0030ED02AB|tara:strand:- start:654 stop:932 length:279 start_codon:yes stop_codon:yes gene_type:complete